MCLMHTDLPVPDGPRIIEIWSSGSAMFSPRSTWLRPNDLCTSMNSIASGALDGRIVAAVDSNSALARPADRARFGHVAQPPIGARGLAPQKICVPSIPMTCTSTRFSTIDLAVARAHADGPTAGVVAVVTADEHDRGGHEHRLDQAVQEVGRILELPEDQEVAAGGDVPDLLHDGDVGGEEARRRSPARYMNGSTSQAASRRVAHRKVIESMPITSSASISSEMRIAPSSATMPGADLRGHHVAERVRRDLAQVAPRGEHARVGRRALRLGEVGALDPALQAEDEHQRPDDQRRADDQDARTGAAPRRRSGRRAGPRRRGRPCP